MFSVTLRECASDHSARRTKIVLSYKIEIWRDIHDPRIDRWCFPYRAIGRGWNGFIQPTRRVPLRSARV